jgi:hypothetical protein
MKPVSEITDSKGNLKPGDEFPSREPTPKAAEHGEHYSLQQLEERAAKRGRAPMPPKQKDSNSLNQNTVPPVDQNQVAELEQRAIKRSRAPPPPAQHPQAPLNQPVAQTEIPSVPVEKEHQPPADAEIPLITINDKPFASKEKPMAPLDAKSFDTASTKSLQGSVDDLDINRVPTYKDPQTSEGEPLANDVGLRKLCSHDSDSNSKKTDSIDSPQYQDDGHFFGKVDSENVPHTDTPEKEEGGRWPAFYAYNADQSSDFGRKREFIEDLERSKGDVHPPMDRELGKNDAFDYEGAGISFEVSGIAKKLANPHQFPIGKEDKWFDSTLPTKGSIHKDLFDSSEQKEEQLRLEEEFYSKMRENEAELYEADIDVERVRQKARSSYDFVQEGEWVFTLMLILVMIGIGISTSYFFI